MKKSKMNFNRLAGMLACTALVAPGMALAEEAASPHSFTANIGLTTDYVFRGISQTSANPAVQGGVDYAHVGSFYAGLWASNVNWITAFGATGTANIELDTYFGFRNTLENEFGYDAGFIRYNYLGSYTPAAGTAKADTDEVYMAASYKWISAKYSYGLGQFLTVPGAQGTNYVEINANVPLGDSGFTLSAHAGKQTYKGTVADALALSGFNPTYSDYKLGISKDFSGFVVTLAYTDTDARSGGFYTTPAGKNLARSTAVLSVTHSF